MNPRRVIVIVCCSVLAACGAASATGVPTIRADELHRAEFEGLVPRSVKLVVLDTREPLPETSRQMVAEVRRALTERLGSVGFAVESDASHEISVRVGYQDEPMPSYEREDCIWFVGKLTAADGAFAEAEGGACFEWRNAYGMDMGGDASVAFETGLGSMLQQLDRGWAKAMAGGG